MELTNFMYVYNGTESLVNYSFKTRTTLKSFCKLQSHTNYGSLQRRPAT